MIITRLERREINIKTEQVLFPVLPGINGHGPGCTAEFPGRVFTGRRNRRGKDFEQHRAAHRKVGRCRDGKFFTGLSCSHRIDLDITSLQNGDRSIFPVEIICEYRYDKQKQQESDE